MSITIFYIAIVDEKADNTNKDDVDQVDGVIQLLPSIDIELSASRSSLSVSSVTQHAINSDSTLTFAEKHKNLCTVLSFRNIYTSALCLINHSRNKIVIFKNIVYI